MIDSVVFIKQDIEDEGKLTCENKELTDWNDIDYLVDIIQENPDKLFE